MIALRRSLFKVSLLVSLLTEVNSSIQVHTSPAPSLTNWDTLKPSVRFPVVPQPFS